MSVNTDLQTDFDGVCRVVRLYLQSQKAFRDENKRQLSSFERRVGGGGAKFQGSDSEAEEAGRRAGLRLDVKYPPAQYQSFTPAEKHYLWLHRAERIATGGGSGGGKKPGKRGRSPPRGDNGSISNRNMKAFTKVMQRQMAAVEKLTSRAKDDANCVVEDEEEEAKPHASDNRDHPSLARQGGRPKKNKI